MGTYGNSHPESRVREEDNVSRMGLEGWAQTAAHILKASQGRRQCEQDGFRGTVTDSHPESRVG